MESHVRSSGFSLQGFWPSKCPPRLDGHPEAQALRQRSETARGLDVQKSEANTHEPWSEATAFARENGQERTAHRTAYVPCDHPPGVFMS